MTLRFVNCLILLCTLCSPVFATENNHAFFGKLSISPEYITTDKHETSIYIYGYLGLRGESQLNQDVDIFYNVSYEMESGREDEDNFTAKDQYLGFKSPIGILAIGRDKTLLKRSEGLVDLFNYLPADIKYLFKGQDRLAQTATYVTPDWFGSNFGLTYVTNANEEQFSHNGYSFAARYGDNLLNDTLIYAAIAVDRNIKGYNIYRATLQTQLNKLLIGGMWQTQEQIYQNGKPVSQPKNTGYLLSLSYPIKKFRFKTQLQKMQRVGNSWAAGIEYNLSNPIDLLLYYVARNYDKNTDPTLLVKSEKYLGININYLF